MSLFDLIRYPVNRNTTDFAHIPDDIWDTYMKKRAVAKPHDLARDRKTNWIIIKIIRDWDSE